MTIEELLRELQACWGPYWIKPTLRRLLILGSMPVLELTDNQVREYRLLHKWALEMIEAGIASKQSQEE